MLLISSNAIAAGWVDFRPCGATSIGDSYRHHKLIPAPNLLEIFIQVDHIMSVIRMKRPTIGLGVQCTRIVLSGGREIMVVGSYEYVVKRIEEHSGRGIENGPVQQQKQE